MIYLAWQKSRAHVRQQFRPTAVRLCDVAAQGMPVTIELCAETEQAAV